MTAWSARNPTRSPLGSRGAKKCESRFTSKTPFRPLAIDVRTLGMRPRAFRHLILCAGIIAHAGLGVATVARADVVLGFPNGLQGWVATIPNLVTASNGKATIGESAIFSETDLYLNFRMPAGA